jgi:hypothetical protein
MTSLVPAVNRGKLDPFERAVLNRGIGHYNYTATEKSFGRKLLAIEDASEDAKHIIFRHMRQILDDIKKGIKSSKIKPSGSFVPNVKISRNAPNSKNKDIYHIDLDLGKDGGHFAAAIVYQNKKIEIFDSMCSEDSQGKSFHDFAVAMRRKYPGYDIIQSCPKGNVFQPSGGFIYCTNSKTNNEQELMTYLAQKNVELNATTRNRYLKYHVFDVLSQHHFCYIEAIIFLSHRFLGTTMGPSRNPEERLVFIKKVIWGLAKLYNASTDKFTNNFPYYLRTTGTRFNNKTKLILPTQQVGFQIKKITMPDQTPTSVKQVIEAAAR